MRAAAPALAATGAGSAPTPPLVLVLQTITALSNSRPLRIPHANLAMPSPLGGSSNGEGGIEAISIMLWVMLLEDATGAYRSLIYKGTGNSARTPSLWLLPTSRQLTFQLTTTRSKEDFGVSRAELPLCAWSHIAYTIGPGTTARLYINGSLDSERATDGAPVSQCFQ